jgi:PAS domain S-box-containing protein
MQHTDTQSRAGDEGRFRLAMASSGIGMAIVGLDGRWLEVNPAFERMFGVSAGEIIGRTAADITHPDDIEESREYLRRLVTGEIPVLDAQKRYLHASGDVVWTHVNVAVMRDADQEPGYLIVQLRDITAQRAAEEALRAWNATLEERVAERTEELERSNRQQEMFAYGVSHDLRAPLRAIDSFSGLLESQYAHCLDSTGHGYLRRIRGATARMGGLIDSMLELSRVSRADLKATDVDVSLLVEWSLAELRDAEPEREADAAVQPDLHAVGDERQLKLMFGQLLQNAWKFSASRDRVRIEVTGERHGDCLRVSIRDQGIGFEPRYAERMFEPFQRLHGPDEGGGNGLGLAIAQRIVERHRGRLWAESEPGTGSVFHLELPTVADGGGPHDDGGTR